MLILAFYILGLVPGFFCTVYLLRRIEVSSGLAFLLVLPLLLWYFAGNYWGPGGTLANAFVEPLLLGIVTSLFVGLALLVYLWLPSTRPTFYYYAVAGSLLAALAITAWFPNLPE